MAFAAEKATALAAVRLACRVCEQVRTTEVLAVSKDDTSPVTTADYAAQVWMKSEKRK